MRGKMVHLQTGTREEEENDKLHPSDNRWWIWVELKPAWRFEFCHWRDGEIHTMAVRSFVCSFVRSSVRSFS